MLLTYRRKCGRLLWILGPFAVLVLYMAYKGPFGTLGGTDKDGKNRLSGNILLNIVEQYTHRRTRRRKGEH